jgi:flagellar biosynthetic protein FliP
MKPIAQPKPQQPAPAGGMPRRSLADIQVFSRPDETAGPVVRQPFRAASRKARFFHRMQLGLLMLVLFFLGRDEARAQSLDLFPTNAAASTPFKFNLGVETGNQPQDVDVGIKVLGAITLLTLAPSIILLMTCFTRIVIVLSFVRTALSLQGTPANQIIIGLSLFITFFIMAPVWEKIDRDALKPYQAKQISGPQALDAASVHIRSFMLKQARPKDVELFVALAKLGPISVDQLPLKVVIPGFIISELRTAFQMGFLLFVPFILIDLVVATVLMSLGMMMMPPTTISLPLKILLFVLVDGWGLVVRSLVQSFAS